MCVCVCVCVCDQFLLFLLQDINGCISVQTITERLVLDIVVSSSAEHDSRNLDTPSFPPSLSSPTLSMIVETWTLSPFPPLFPHPPFLLFSHCLQKSHRSDWDNIYKQRKILVRTNSPIKAPLLALPYGKPPLPSTFHFLYFFIPSLLLSSPFLSLPSFPLLPPPPERNNRKGLERKRRRERMKGMGRKGEGREGEEFLPFSFLHTL